MSKFAKKIVLVDQDGVLADFSGSVLEIIKNRKPHMSHIEQERGKHHKIYKEYPGALHEEIKMIYAEKGFIENLPAIEGAIEAMNEMREAGLNVFICTSPLSKYENCVPEKYKWVEKHLGKEWVKKIILTGDKTLVSGDYLIDDNPEILGVNTPSWEHIVFDYPFNKHLKDKRRLTSWGKWREIIN